MEPPQPFDFEIFIAMLTFVGAFFGMCHQMTRQVLLCLELFIASLSCAAEVECIAVSRLVPFHVRFLDEGFSAN